MLWKFWDARDRWISVFLISMLSYWSTEATASTKANEKGCIWNWPLELVLCCSIGPSDQTFLTPSKWWSYGDDLGATSRSWLVPVSAVCLSKSGAPSLSSLRLTYFDLRLLLSLLTKTVGRKLWRKRVGGVGDDGEVNCFCESFLVGLPRWFICCTPYGVRGSILDIFFLSPMVSDSGRLKIDGWDPWNREKMKIG